TATNTVVPSDTATTTPSPTDTATTIVFPSVTPTNSPTVSGTATNTATASWTSTPTSTASATATVVAFTRTDTFARANSTAGWGTASDGNIWALLSGATAPGGTTGVSANQGTIASSSASLFNALGAP